MLTRENAISSIIAADPAQNFPVMASSDVELLINQIFDDFEAQMETLDDKYAEAVNLYESAVMEFYKKMKAKDEEIERLKKAIDTSIEEIEYAIKKPQYAEVYLGNAIRFLKNNA